jgi:hypothetical protein
VRCYLLYGLSAGQVHPTGTGPKQTGPKVPLQGVTYCCMDVNEVHPTGLNMNAGQVRLQGPALKSPYRP